MLELSSKRKTYRMNSFFFRKEIIIYRWKPGEFLGQGSFASVIMGFNEETGQIMAVKQVRLNEASKLSNVNIPK